MGPSCADILSLRSQFHVVSALREEGPRKRWNSAGERSVTCPDKVRYPGRRSDCLELGS